MATITKPSRKPSKTASFHRLHCLSVIGGFLDDQAFEFTDGLNCLIGGRGTGKTTALEFVRYALDAMPNHDGEPAERKRIESLVGENLGGGRIELGIETRDGMEYTVTRSWGEEPIVLDADRTPTELTLRSNGLFAADIFSQNEVERIADLTSAQLDLIDNFEIERIANVNAELRQVQSDLAANAAQLLRFHGQRTATSDELGQLPTVEAKLQAFAGPGGDASDEINQAHRQKSLRDREQRVATSAAQILANIGQNITKLAGTVQQQAGGLVEGEMAGGPNGPILKGIAKHVLQCGHDLDQMFQGAEKRISQAEQQTAELVRQLSLVHKEQELQFRNLLEKHQQAQGQAAERTRLERLRNELLDKRRTRDELHRQVTALQAERTRLLERLSELYDCRFAIRMEVAERITGLLAPAIRVSIIQFGNPESYQRLLENKLRGARIKHGLVAAKLANSFWPADLSPAIADKNVRLLVDKAELNYDQAEKVVATLEGMDTLCELETVELMDLPQIELKDGETYKDCATLSTGQKCTAILPILLLDSDKPLLIDQPEDNLDNRFIFETVVDSIRKIKPRRQLIFVTHNPNIPVLGDAERVFVLDSNGTNAQKANEGTVDQCKSQIVTLLEGGEEAFKRRKARYAY